MNSTSVSADHSGSGVARMQVTYAQVELAIGFPQSLFQIVKRLQARLFKLFW